MSLNQLINTVGIKLNISQDEANKKICKIFDSIGTKPFTARTLASCQLSEPEIDIIINNMINNHLVYEYITYYCNITGISEETKSINDNCCGCNKPLLTSTNHHELESIYELNPLTWNDYIKERDSILFTHIDRNYKYNLELLLDNSDNAIPFIGAGMSVPLGLPDWKGLLVELNEQLPNNCYERYEQFINAGDYFKAIDYLITKSFTMNSDNQVKRYIRDKIEGKVNFSTNGHLHNYNDLVSLNSHLYLTTNYDTCLTYFLNERGYHTIPQNILDIEDVSEILKGNKINVVHLHGLSTNSKSMIVTQKDYEDLYEDINFKTRMIALLAGKSFIFIGFSFNDAYYGDLYKRVVQILGGQHFIVVPNADLYDVKMWAKHNLHVIGLNIADDKQTSMVQSIRIFLGKLNE